MGNHLSREKELDELLKDNFMGAKKCRSYQAVQKDVSLAYFFKFLASRRSQMAMELGEEIRFFGGSKPLIPEASFSILREKEGHDQPYLLVKKCRKFYKRSIEKYSCALARINEGSCREILLRHRAYLQSCLWDLKCLQQRLRPVFKQEQIRNHKTDIHEIH